MYAQSIVPPLFEYIVPTVYIEQGVYSTNGLTLK